jgi:hypothetical protein
MRSLILAAGFILAFSLPPIDAWAAACPPGSFPGFDNFGNSICKNFDDGGTRSIQNRGRGCPAGTIPDFDNFGNQNCKSLNSGQRFYDTSKGCPTGTIAGFDNFGNQVCKRL